MYTFEQLKADVKIEADNLKVHATKEELERLISSNLTPTNSRHCIYGLMTGDCYSLRAAELINDCTTRYFKHGVMPDPMEGRQINISRVSKYVNGTKVDGFIKERTDRMTVAHFSAIEAYILLPEAKNANLIAYLRSETDTLDL